MARYIEADALLEELQEELDFESLLYTKEQNEWFNKGLKCAVRDVKHQPTAEVAEVVRCKDCRYADYLYSCGKYLCKKGCGATKSENDFCSYGERRKDDG